MKHLPLMALFAILIACDSGRIYEENEDFEGPFWPKGSIPEFTFNIEDVSDSYNIFINVRNGFEYPFYNLYYEFDLQDSVGKTIDKDMLELILFDAKTGEPLGSGLGDLFDHQKPVLENYQFPYPGSYSIAYTHFMRTDTLPLVLSVGTRVEKVED